MVACCQTSIKSYFHRGKKTEIDPGTLPQLLWSSLWQGYLIWFWKGTKQFNRHTCHSKKCLSLLGHLKTFNLKALRTLRSSWKKDIERVQTQGPTSRNCPCSHQKKLCSRVAEIFGNRKIRPAKVQCLVSPWKKTPCHQDLLRDFAGKNVCDSYLRDSRRPQKK